MYSFPCNLIEHSFWRKICTISPSCIQITTQTAAPNPIRPHSNRLRCPCPLFDVARIPHPTTAHEMNRIFLHTSMTDTCFWVEPKQLHDERIFRCNNDMRALQKRSKRKILKKKPNLRNEPPMVRSNVTTNSPLKKSRAAIRLNFWGSILN